VQYGDGLSYSLPISQYIKNGDDNLQSGDEFYIAAGEGQIKDLVVLGTDSEGQSSTNVEGMDDAYDLPSSSGQTNAVFFQTGGLTIVENEGTPDEETFVYPDQDPNEADNTPNNRDPLFHDDLDSSWDITLGALQPRLDGDDMVFFFQNNQEGKPGEAVQSLAVWAQLWITGPDSEVVLDENGVGFFEFTNDGGQYDLFFDGGGGTPLGDPSLFTSSTPTTEGNPTADLNTLATDYVLSGGEICLSTAPATFGIPVTCDPNNPDVTDPFVHNISDAYASYAVVFPELNALISSLFEISELDLSLYTLHVDYRLGCDPTLYGTDASQLVCTGQVGNESIDWGKSLNGGGEKLWIGAAFSPDDNHDVPVPGVLSLLGLGALSLGFANRRKRKQSA
jgi:hypothetical protein